MAIDDGNINIGSEETENFSLESILAEYKGSAYIEGDKKTPSDVLDKKAQRIVSEVTGKEIDAPENIADYRNLPPEKSTEMNEPRHDMPRQSVYDFSGGLYSSNMNESPEFNKVSAVYRPEGGQGAGSAYSAGGSGNVSSEDDIKVYNPRGERIKASPMGSTIRSSVLTENDENEFFAPLNAAAKKRETEKYQQKVQYSAPLHQDEIQQEVARQMSSLESDTDEYYYDEDEYGEGNKKKPQKGIFGIFSRRKNSGRAAENEAESPDEFDYEDIESEPEPEYEPEEEIEEISLKKAMERFAKKCNSVSTRFLGAFMITLIMAVFTFVFDSGASMKFGIGRDVRIVSGVLLVMQLLVMILSTDILWRGIADFIVGEPGIESVILASGIFTILASFCSIFGYYGDIGSPYCLVVAASLTFALWGEKKYLSAMVQTTKLASSDVPLKSVVPFYSKELEQTVLRRSKGGASGFYSNLVQADFCESTYKYASPVIMIASIVFAFLASLGHNRAQYFVHFLSALLASGSSFSAFFAYAVPFSNTVRIAKRSGAVIAGWGGVEEMFFSDGACVTDEDLFPPGTLSLGGIKLFGNSAPEAAIRYTSSLIAASGSGLAPLFSRLLDEHGMALARVDNFACYEGGVGGIIKGGRVLTGSSAFMNLMGIRVPADIDMGNVVFTAVNDRLIAAFIVNYIPANAVQGGLLNLINKNVDMFFANKDFNITPQMLGSKFRIPFDGVNQMPASDIYEDETYPDLKSVALLARDGLGAFGTAITEGKKLRILTCITTIASVATTVLGVLLVFFMCWAGAFSSMRPSRIFMYMTAMLIVVVLIGNMARPRK